VKIQFGQECLTPKGYPLDKNRWIITGGAFASMSFIGMSRTFLGTALPAIRSSLDLSLVQAGTFTVCLQFGFAGAVFAGGLLSDVFKKSAMLLLGCLLTGVNLLLFGLSPWFWMNLIAMIFVGIGGGLIEASSDPLLIQLFPGRESTVMNLHHFFYSFGSFVGPPIIGVLLAKSLPWQWGYIGFGLFVLAVFLFLSSQKISSPQSPRRFDFILVKRMLNQRFFWILFWVTFCTMGVQNSIAYWIVTFLKEERGFSIPLASASLSLFFVCMGVGRLLSSYVTTKLHDVVLLISLFSLHFVSLLITVSVPGLWVVLFLMFCGFAQSAVFPCLLALTGKLYPKNPGTAMGLVSTGAGLGSMVVPWLLALVSQLTSLQTGFFFLDVFLLICLGLMGLGFRGFRMANVK
jgi:FHS family glucose/mannose:H+ symporter-like MFS transporter